MKWQQTNFIQITLLITSSPGKRATVGYEDGTLKLWDLRQGIHTFHLSGNYIRTGIDFPHPFLFETFISNIAIDSNDLELRLIEPSINTYFTLTVLLFKSRHTLDIDTCNLRSLFFDSHQC